MGYSLEELIKYEPNELVEVVGMADMPLISYTLYHKYSRKVEFIDTGSDCVISFNGINIANMSYLAAFIHFIKIEDNRLRIEGNISLPACFKEFCEFYPLVNGERYDLRFFDAHLDLCFDDGACYEKRTAYELVVDLSDARYKDRKIEIAFAFDTKGIRSICGKINSMRFAPAADCLPEQYAVRNGYSLTIRDHTLICDICDERVQRALERIFIEKTKETLGEKADFVCGIREEYFRRLRAKKKPIWLFFDRIDKADDNGEAMFRYVCGLKRTDIDCFFVISKDSPDYDRIKSIGNVIDALSFEHCVTLPLADYIVTSQLNGYVETPYGEYEEYFRDIYHQPRVVFLQHGVTKDDQTKWLNRFYNDLYSIVVSAGAERDSFLELDYFYKPESIWLTGMPRYDLLEDKKEKNILIMPTWRKRYMEQKYDECSKVWKWQPTEAFEKSDYRRAYKSLLGSRRLRRWCERLGYKLIFMPHPIVQPYAERFDIPDHVARYPYATPWRELFEKSALMITDYSSVAFDFAYMEKPVIYYQFDRESFFKGHSYKEGYYDYGEMGFGEVVSSERKLVRLLIEYMKNDCGEPPVYRERVRKFFAYRDRNSRERIFGKIMSAPRDER